MADLTGRNADETKPDIATWGTGNVLETGEGTVKVDLDGKVAISDIINNLTSEDENKPLSAKQGKLLNDNKASLSRFEEGEHTVTLTPSQGGSITLRSDRNTMHWQRSGDLVHVQGMIQVDSVSSPEGGQVQMSLPFVIAEKTGTSGRVGGSIVDGVSALKPFITRDNESRIRIVKDASTQDTGLDGRYYFSFTYVKA